MLLSVAPMSDGLRAKAEKLSFDRPKTTLLLDFDVAEITLKSRGENAFAVRWFSCNSV